MIGSCIAYTIRARMDAEPKDPENVYMDGCVLANGISSETRG